MFCLLANTFARLKMMLDQWKRKMSPVFDQPLKPLSINEGEKLHLSCHVRGSLPMNIQWMKDRKEITSSAKTRITFVDGTATLEISSASKTDAGDYLCKATNDTLFFIKKKIYNLYAQGNESRGTPLSGNKGERFSLSLPLAVIASFVGDSAFLIENTVLGNTLYHFGSHCLPKSYAIVVQMLQPKSL
uniref:Ig-like domain-containing protein n=1 Tax=Paramormyrops kingsleyae TaxID=1676925 RepID=A0A3B3QCK9_9TELE